MKRIQPLLKLTLVLLLAFVISFNSAVEKAVATGQFSLTCPDYNIPIPGSTLVASCKTRNGALQQTSIDLDQYIVNLDGTLAWGDKDFSKSCKDIRLTQLLGTRELVLVADCKTIAGDFHTTEINLDDHIANIDGNLQYE